VLVIELLVNIPNPHLKTPTHPSTPEVLRAREYTPTPFISVVFTFGLAMNPSKSLGVHHSFYCECTQLHYLDIELPYFEYNF
jgi:hypothetical protein